MRAKPDSIKTLASAVVFVTTVQCGVRNVAADDPHDPPTGFYDSARGLHGSALKSALHAVIDDHTMVPYSWPPFQDVDEAATDPAHVDLIYSNSTRAKNRNGGNVGDWNREHLWPKSYGIGNDGADSSDIFNLRPSDVQVNSERGSLYFDDTAPGGAIPLQFAAPGCSKDGDSWEPRDDEKGEIARSCFYMAVRYDGSDAATSDLELSDAPISSQSRFGKLITLLDWHRLDPVDERERKRNHDVFTRWQGNRNPFIDRPEFAEQLFLKDYPGRDTDRDGISDWWEWRKAGSLDESATSDGDGDGYPTLLEFLFNDDPSGVTPARGILLEVESSGTIVQYRRNALAQNIAVVIEGSPALNAVSWQPLDPVSQSETLIDAESSLVTLTFDSNSLPRYFYRLRGISSR